MKTDCKKIQDQLFYYVLNELPAEKAAIIKEHLENCIVCQDLAIKFEDTAKAIIAEKNVVATYALRNRIFEQVKQGKADNPKLIRLQFFKAYQVAAAIIVLFVAVYSGITIGKSVINNNQQAYYSNETEPVVEQYSSYIGSYPAIENYLYIYN